MTNNRARPVVLVVEDDDALRGLLSEALPRVGFDVETASGLAQARQLLASHSIDIVLTDIHLDGESGIALCAELKRASPFVPTLVMTAFGSLDLAVEALRAGAWDFLTKPLDLSLARIALERALEHRRLRLEVRRLRRRARVVDGVGELWGDSEPMRRLFGMIGRVASTSSSVLITGESGTGKELVARALHQSGARRDGPFVALNCAAVPEHLLESELFGHVRGAFTDARSDRTGLFVRAGGGTVFLDEIGDMPLALQAKLLRVVQERTVRPVGGEKELRIDVRLLAATHQDLDGAVQQGRFRSDLLYRLDVIRVEVPPLRERGTDVLLLAQKFVQTFAAHLNQPVQRLGADVAAKLLDYDWPGNVRELRNCIERGVVLAEFDTLSVGDLPAKVRDARPRSTVLAAMDDPVAMISLAEMERRYILKVLAAVDGRRSRAADILRIDRKTLYRKLDRWGDSTNE